MSEKNVCDSVKADRRKFVRFSLGVASMLAVVGITRRAPGFDVYVVTEKCIKCKYMDCVEVCPVDAFYEGENMLVINPDECISCGACEPECPIGAILPDNEPVSWRWIQINAKYSGQWPNINRKRLPPEDANQYTNVSDKFQRYFSAKPGLGS